MGDRGAGIAELMAAVSRLKRTPRTGWLHRGVPHGEAESVADHGYGVALLAWLTTADEPGLDRDRVLKLALIHDLAEAITGDLTPYNGDQIPPGDDAAAFLNRRHLPDETRRAAKAKAEQRAMEALTKELPEALRNELLTLWREYSERATPEARFVKEVDRLEAFLQSRAYLAGDSSRPMAAFEQEVIEELSTPVLKAIRDEALGDTKGA